MSIAPTPGTSRRLAAIAAAETLPDGKGFDRLCRDIDAAPAKPSLTDLMNGVYAKCPLVREIEFEPSISMDTRTGKVRIKEWSVWLRSGDPRALDTSFGQESDLIAAIEDAIKEYTEKNGPDPRPADAVAATNAAALADLSRLAGLTTTPTDLGDGMGLPLICVDPAGITGCRFCDPLSGGTGECDTHRKYHAEKRADLDHEAAADEADARAEGSGRDE